MQTISLPAPATPLPSGVQWLEAVLENPVAETKGEPSVHLPDAGSEVLSVLLPGGARMEVGNAVQAKLAAGLLRALEAGEQQAC